MSKALPQQFISLANAAKLCDYSQDYLSLRARQGKLRSIKMGRNWVTKKDWLTEYVKNNNGNGDGLKNSSLALLKKVSQTKKDQKAPVQNDFISLDQASQNCAYSQEYLSLRARQGKLRAIKMGRNWVTKKDWLVEYLATSNNSPHSHNHITPIIPEVVVETKKAPKLPKREKRQLFGDILPSLPSFSFDFTPIFDFQFTRQALVACFLILAFSFSIFGLTKNVSWQDAQLFSGKVLDISKEFASNFQSISNLKDKSLAISLEINDKIQNNYALGYISDIAKASLAMPRREIARLDSSISNLSIKMFQGSRDILFSVQDILISKIDALSLRAWGSLLSLKTFTGGMSSEEKYQPEEKLNFLASKISNLSGGLDEINEISEGVDKLVARIKYNAFYISRGVKTLPSHLSFYLSKDFQSLGKVAQKGAFSLVEGLGANISFLGDQLGQLALRINGSAMAIFESSQQSFQKFASFTFQSLPQTDIFSKVKLSFQQTGESLFSRVDKIKKNTEFLEASFTSSAQGLLGRAFQTIKKPFLYLADKLTGAKNYFSRVWGQRGQNKDLSLNNQVEQKEPNQVEPDLLMQDEAKGLIVIPSTDKDEEIKQKIRDSFSDEVRVIPKDGDSGIIIPVFKEKEGDEYLYLMVPIQN